MSKDTHTIDASEEILGRLASEIAFLLQGKHRPDYSPNLVLNNEIIVINTSKIKVSGRKTDLKKYYSHSGYIGGIKEIIYKKLFAKDPNEILKRAVYGMLPRNKLRNKRMKKLKLYANNIK